MVNDLLLIHRKSAQAFEVSETAQGSWLLWQTCLRKIAFGEQAQLASLKLEPDDQVYVGFEAYEFCLQVVCGLHSPLIGETEVYGQFKNAVADFLIPNTSSGLQWRRFFQNIFEDAKKVRQSYLVDLGSQSYGSVLRRELKGLLDVHILGAGHLVQEILPWLCKEGIRVHVHCRDLSKAKKDLAAFPVQLHRLDDQAELTQAEAVVVAAPMPASWIGTWLQDSKPRYIADLRGESAHDTLAVSPAVRLVDLNAFLQRISGNQKQAEKAREMALLETASLAQARRQHIEYRPFGWEDLCA